MASKQDPDSSWRVKLYQLSSDGQWDDKGTGQLVCKTTAQGRVVLDMKCEGGDAESECENAGADSTAECGGNDAGKENTPELRPTRVPAAASTANDGGDADDANADTILLRRTISEHIAYERQGENIITWNEPDVEGGAGVDLALSFQEHKGTLDVWRRICKAQGSYTSDFNDSGHCRPSDVEECGAPPPLPACSRAALEDMTRALEAASETVVQRELASEQLLADDCLYLRQIATLFENCEDMDDEEGLALLHRVCERVLRLNEPTLLQEMLSRADVAMLLAGAFEYDPEARDAALRAGKPHQRHRAELTDGIGSEMNLREVVPIRDESVRQKIAMNQRLDYFKTHVLRPVALDDETHNILANLRVFNSTDIIEAMLMDEDYMQQLYHVLRYDPSHPEANADVACNAVDDSVSDDVTASSEPTSAQHSQHQRRRRRRRRHQYDCPLARREDAARLLVQMCHTATNMQAAPRVALCKALTSIGGGSGGSECMCFEAIGRLMWRPEMSATDAELSACAEVLAFISDNVADEVRAYIIGAGGHPPKDALASAGGTPGEAATLHAACSGADGMNRPNQSSDDLTAKSADSPLRAPLLLGVLRLLCPPPGTRANDVSLATRAHAAAVLRLLLDTETMEGTSKDAFLGLFYESYMPHLLQPLAMASNASIYGSANITASERAPLSHGACTLMNDDELARAASFDELLDTLGLCLELHEYRIKYFVLRHDVVSKVLCFLKSPHKFLRLSALRLVRKCVGVKDDFYNRYLVKNDLFAPIFECFRENGASRDNLLNSAIVELLEFIRTENIKTLVDYIVGKYRTCFEHLKYVETFEMLVRMYEEDQDTKDAILSAQSNAPVAIRSWHKTNTAGAAEGSRASYPAAGVSGVGGLSVGGTRYSYCDDTEAAYWASEERASDVDNCKEKDQALTSSSTETKAQCERDPLQSLHKYGSDEDDDHDSTLQDAPKRREEDDDGTCFFGAAQQISKLRAAKRGKSSVKLLPLEIAMPGRADNVSPPLGSGAGEAAGKTNVTVTGQLKYHASARAAVPAAAAGAADVCAKRGALEHASSASEEDQPLPKRTKPDTPRG